MKKNFKYAMMMATALVLGFSSCSSDNDPIEGGGSHVIEGRATKASIKIQSPVTYASTGVDQSATAEETEIKTVNVYVYNHKSGVLEDTESYDLSGKTGTTDSATKVTTWVVGEMRTTTGLKKMFVVANQPASVSEDDVNTVDKLTSLAKTLTIAELATADKFAMSSNIEEPTFKKMEVDASGNPTVIPAGNQIEIPIRRMVAKVTVKEKNTFTVEGNGNIIIEGGKLIAESGKNALSFAVGNLNATSYMAQRIERAQVITPNYSNIGEKPGFGLVTVGTGTDETVKLPEGYMEVNKHSVADDAVTAVYAPENTRDEKKKGDMTYVVIKGQFLPNDITTFDSADSKWVVENPTSVATFYRIKTRDGNYYFKDINEAKTFAKDVLKHADGEADQDDKIKALIKTYEDGYCYYTVYPNQENDYDVLRNEFYNLSINKIMGLGDPTPGPQTDEDAEDVVGINTTIDVKVTIQPWEMYTEDVNLKPQA